MIVHRLMPDQCFARGSLVEGDLLLGCKLAADADSCYVGSLKSKQKPPNRQCGDEHRVSTSPPGGQR